MLAISYIIRFIFKIKFGLIFFIIILNLILIIKRKELIKTLNDKYLELLLRFIDIAFEFSKKYRKNIENFNGKYVFKTRDPGIYTSVTFEDGNMKVYDDKKINWDIKIIFKDCKTMREALRSIILTGSFDLLDCMLEDKIETVGNINYAFKFMFLVNNLTRRLGIG